MHEREPIKSNRLAGAVAVVFGGGNPGGGVNVGQAAAVAYSAAGAQVVVVDAILANAERTAQLLPGCRILQADITSESSVSMAIGDIVERLGRIDVLHNNVGVPIAGDFESLGQAIWQRGFALNCVGAATTMRLAMPHLVASQGAIVNVSSIASIRHTGMNYAVYNASKAALDQLTVAVAIEYAGRGVRANAILPGLIDSDMGRGLSNVEERNRRSPSGQQGDVWDVANAAVFLASPEARYINGHLLVVDGGLSRRC
ncbi:NAD(P)-dependent dehydrogenase, short-chain alcohol dehydrogenase family [Novosphingobium sp. CF614]|uniref:SDR family NAD(P)-dependent oxidoreductase n=1 Tax=Novosphingobium sp. CF614 TaxID=1884364 RepID=UPI0008EA8AA8|nr:SDR family oxidoreductase [Novosphingobium sp. CF614]SFG47206.1 NAD(P)-dependent dehydrogenase, short-chain alcohol dehydrogenase family [Novosphingobium sp. CF614]